MNVVATVGGKHSHLTTDKQTRLVLKYGSLSISRPGRLHVLLLKCTLQISLFLHNFKGLLCKNKGRSASSDKSYSRVSTGHVL